MSRSLRLRKGWLLALLGLCTWLNVSAQLTLKGDPVTAEFPRVSFKAHYRSPDALDSTAFSLKADDKKIPFTVTPVAVPDSDLSKSVLILWEYLPAKAREAQNKYFRQVIQEALPELLGDGD